MIKAVAFDFNGVVEIETGPWRREINRDLLELVKRIRSQGIKTALLSNAGPSLRYRLNTEGLAGYFDEMVLSGEVGFLKPGREIFDVLIAGLKVRPEELVVVDDAPVNLLAAGEVGYVPLVFEDNDRLKRDLIAAGIEI